MTNWLAWIMEELEEEDAFWMLPVEFTRYVTPLNSTGAYF